ncbi:MAG: DUF455 family protein [Polyangiaceae bacterium]|nr:DUF455 family protein [Polyangiaceae bacterium]
MTSPADTIERWLVDYVTTTSLAHKLHPPPRPSRWGGGAPARMAAPGRPPELVVEARARKRPRAGALVDPRRRAELFHTLLHHELQAAELFAWAALAFADAPASFRAGLLGVLDDEVRHLSMYREHLAELGAEIGDFPVRDWFWQRVPSCASPLAFVSLMGLGLEGANLDHAARLADELRRAGDARGAEIARQVGEEEIVHVKFAKVWFERWAGPLLLDAWARELPAPLSPALLRGVPMDVEARRRAGFDDEFLRRLAACELAPRGS